MDTRPVVVITGATNGLGRLAALDLARSGAHLGIVARSQRKVDELRREIQQVAPGTPVDSFIADLTSMRDVRTAGQRIASVYERIDVLINNAGVHAFSQRITPDGFSEMTAVNYLAPWVLTTTLRDKLVAYATRPFIAFNPQTRFFIGYGILVVSTTLLLVNNYSSGFTENYREGDVVTRTVISPADITTVDISEKEKRRAAAREATRPIFNFDSSRAESSVQSFRSGWEDLKKRVATGQNKPQLWNGEGGVAVSRAIISHNFDDEDLDRITNLIREVGAGYIYDDNDADRLKQEIVLVDIRNPTAQMIMPAPRTRMTALSAARRNLELRILNLQGWSQEQKTALASALTSLIRPNVVLDQTATATAQESAADTVNSVAISLKRNQVLAREGDTVTPGMLAQFAAIKSTGHSGKPWHNLVGLLLIVMAVYWAAWKFTEHRGSGSSLALSKRRAFALVGSAIVVQTALMRVGFTFGDGVAARMSSAPFNDPNIWNFAIPFAAAALLVAMLVDTQLAFLTGIITALFAGIIAANGMNKAIFACLRVIIKQVE